MCTQLLKVAATVCTCKSLDQKNIPARGEPFEASKTPNIYILSSRLSLSPLPFCFKFPTIICHESTNTSQGSSILVNNTSQPFFPRPLFSPCMHTYAVSNATGNSTIHKQSSPVHQQQLSNRYLQHFPLLRETREKLPTAILVCLHLSSPFTFPMFVQSKEFIKRVKKWLIKEPIPPIDVKVVLLIHTRTEKGTCHLLLPLSDPAPISFHGCPNEHAPVITSAIPYRTICNIGVSVAFQHALGISERGSKGEKHAASQEEFLPVVPVVPGPEVCVPGLRCFLRS